MFISFERGYLLNGKHSSNTDDEHILVFDLRITNGDGGIECFVVKLESDNR